MLLTLESWAEPYVIQPGATVQIVVDGGVADQYLELEQLPGGLTIYGVTGGIITVFSDGKELEPDFPE